MVQTSAEGCGQLTMEFVEFILQSHVVMSLIHY